MGENRFLYRGIKYNIFGLIPKTSYVTQTLNIKYRGTIEPRAKLISPGFYGTAVPKTTPMYLPEMVSYDIAVIAKLMLWDTMFDKSRHRL